MKTLRIAPSVAATATVALLLALPACGDNQAPGEATALWQRIHDAPYRNFARAPGYDTRMPSSAAHGDAVDIFVNDVTRRTVDAKKPLDAWPTGSLIVKDGYEDGDLAFVAVMEKRGDGWFFAEYDKEGSAKYSGKPGLCIDCHQSGSDFVRAFALPR